MTANVALLPSWLRWLWRKPEPARLTVLRPGQRVVQVPGLGVTVSRRAVSAAAPPAENEPYLLDFANYGQSAGVRTIGRDFTVAVSATCVGARFYGPYGCTSANIRLWRTDTSAQAGAEEGVAATAYAENIISFSTPVALSTGITYRLSIYNITSTYYGMWYGVNDHPDGPVTILSATAFRYDAADVYPDNPLGDASAGIEPTIMVT